MPVLTVGSKRILYIHVPKTGGTSVEDLLRSYGGRVSAYYPSRGVLPCTPQHFHRDLLLQIFGSPTVDKGIEHDFDFIFMTVRHPISRLLSEYRYQRSATLSRKLNPVARLLSFDLWCRYVLRRASRDPLYKDNHFRPQVDFAVWDPAVFRIEDGLDGIREKLDSLVGAKGTWPAKPHKVSTSNAGSEGKLHPGTRALIHTYYASDFENFNYGLNR